MKGEKSDRAGGTASIGCGREQVGGLAGRPNEDKEVVWTEMAAGIAGTDGSGDKKRG